MKKLLALCLLCSCATTSPVKQVKASESVKWAMGEPMGCVYDKEHLTLLCMTPAEFADMLDQVHELQKQRHENRRP